MQCTQYTAGLNIAQLRCSGTGILQNFLMYSSLLQVGKALVDLFAEMIFIQGFVHGDPHPGNILISPEGEHGFSLGK